VLRGGRAQRQQETAECAGKEHRAEGGRKGGDRAGHVDTEGGRGALYEALRGEEKG